MTAPHAQHAGAGPRLVRTAVFTAVCVVLAAIGHALASCATVPWWSLGIGFLAVFAAAAPLAGRRRTLPGIGVGLTAGQLALHTLFGLGQHGSAAAQAPAGSSDTSVAALAAQLVCGGNSVPLDPASARQIVEAAGLDPAALAARSLDEGQAVHAHLAHAAGPAPETGLFSPAMLIGHLLAALAMRLAARSGRRRARPARRAVPAVHRSHPGTGPAHRAGPRTRPRHRTARRARP